MTADAGALEARKAAGAGTEPAPAARPLGQPPTTVTSLHEWRLAHLPPDTRPLPSVSHYDQMLRRLRSSGHREGEAQTTDSRLCAAIVDRLTSDGTIIETGIDSYRLVGTRARAEEPAKAG